MLNKICSKIYRKFLFILDGVNTKKYMMAYNKWLKKNGVDINGKIKYIHHTVSFDGGYFDKLHIGDNCVISKGVVILCHDYSIEAGLHSLGINKPDCEGHFIKDVYIGDNCFIGANTIILPGTIIGKNCIVGSGTVLSGKTYPDNSVIVGNPSRVISNVDSWTRKKIEEGEILF